MNEKKYESLIRFRRSDAGKLSYAIRQFNKKIKELEGLEREFAPEELKYSEVKERITSRKEFNRVLKSLKRFTRKGQEDIVKLDSGENISKWERHELNLASKRATKMLTLEYMKEVQNPVNVFGMKNDRISQIESTLENINKIENATGGKFKKIKERIFKLGVTDKELKKAKIFKENFLKDLNSNRIKNFKNYNLFINYINTKLKNPIKFYETIQKSEVFSNIFLWYDSEQDTLYPFGDYKTNEEGFNNGLEELGILK